MPLPDNLLRLLEGDIRQLLQHAGVAQASIHVERVGKSQQHQTFHENEEEERGGTEDSEGTVIYAIGSLTKILVALLISIIVDKLPYSEELGDRQYRTLRTTWPNPKLWDVSFTTLFNHFSDEKMSSLSRDPTLRHVLLHYNSLPPMNYILLAPEGTSLISKKEFIRVAPSLAQAAYGNSKQDYIAYSNGNYILVGLLIEAIIAPQQDTLEGLMEKHIFQPLGMTRTYMTAPDSTDISNARPHVVSARGRQELIETLPYPADAVVIPAMGARSCTRDLAILLRTIQKCINGDGTIFNQDLVNRLLKPEVFSPKHHAHTLCGIWTTLDTSILGSKSINRLITPVKICSTYRLGCTPNGKQVTAYYQAGAVNGYASCFYFMPKWNTFIIVLTNTSGCIDASDHISRLILQAIFDLELNWTDLAVLAAKRLDRALGIRASDLKAKVDIPSMSSRAKDEGQNLLNRWKSEDTQGDKANLPQIQLEGTYLNKLSEQSIVIWRHKGRFLARMRGPSRSSKDMGLIRIGDWMIRLCPLNEYEFTIERYDPYGWKELSFKLRAEKDSNSNQRVVCMERRGALLLDKYERLETGE